MKAAIRNCANVYSVTQPIDEGMGNYVLVRQQLRPRGLLPPTNFKLSLLIRSRLDVVAIGEFNEQVTTLLNAPSLRKVIEETAKHVQDPAFMGRSVTGGAYREMLRLCIEQENQLIVTRIPEDVSDAIDSLHNTWALRSLNDDKPRDGFHWQVARDAVFHESGAHFTVPLQDSNLSVHLSPSSPQPNTEVFKLLVYLLAWEIWERRNSPVFLRSVKEGVNAAIEYLIRQVIVNYDLPIPTYRGLQRYTIANKMHEVQP